ncbi:heme biosynthesis HemY N-terminal domain-containing protein [Parachitinimonas caeni]|uniref:Heme biosynthesis HemY N-terminal domain-containing protein n=1 Tax=Parachitinimonas caeni TaxID=3031301 RepID=A0ABT7DVK4_9NEIS|nr:heme biosynthesis HemY N-terminal domain-containing protein [Parachitinimonas caeni]MDK2124096.1 heme biosynthesis HemY N-terminal domain-containing protein [Parachitinimonas caeni]
MRILIWAIALFAIAVGLAQFAQINTGYALLFVPPYRVELSLNTFVLLILAVIGLGYGALRLVDWVLLLPNTVRRYRGERRIKEARALQQDALLAWFEGRYIRAEKSAQKARELETEPRAQLVNSLIGAKAAHAYRNFETRDRYLEEARSASKDNSLALAMIEAELLYEQRRSQDALAAVERALAISPRLTAALRLELRIRQQLNQPERVLELVSQLERSDALDTEQSSRIRIYARIAQIERGQMSPSELKDWWSKIDEKERVDPRLASTAGRCFAEIGEGKIALEIVAEAIQANPDSGLIELYGRLANLGGREIDTLAQLQQAESWLKTRPDDHVLLLALGRLCRARGLWGKAQNYLEASIAVQPSVVAHAELAQLLEHIGQPDQADRHFRRSLALALDR